ncbi:MAG: transcription-repair-coupling factor [Deltaproteobacteria bacterium]|nr:MAG: transcription-repair-coupling factor [Deltaproteobacteria bacterium]
MVVEYHEFKNRHTPTHILKALSRSRTFLRLTESIKNGKTVIKVSGLKGSSGLALIPAIQRATGKPLLYILPSKERVRLVSESLSFYLGEPPPFLLGRETNLEGAILSSARWEKPNRIEWLYFADKKNIVLAEARSVFERLIPKEHLLKSTLSVEVGSKIPRDNLLLRLAQMGYTMSDFVQRKGDMSARGLVVDVFSPGAPNPIRIEFFGDEVASIRHFNPQDQKSVEKVEKAIILPAGELIMDEEGTNRCIIYIKGKASREEIPASFRTRMIEDLRERGGFSDIELFIPAFYPKTDTVFDYIPPDSIVVLEEPKSMMKAIEDAREELLKTLEVVKKRLKIAPDTDELLLEYGQVESRLSQFQRIQIEDVGVYEEGIETLVFETHTIEREEDPRSPFESLSEKISGWQSQGFSVFIVLKSKIELERFENILKEHGIRDVNLLLGDLPFGFIFPEAGLVVITEKEIIGEKKRLRSYPLKDIPSAFITSFSELKPGDYIVHVNFGIGIFRGLKRLRIENVEGDFLQCEYAGGDKIYVPVDKLKLVQRYIGEGPPPRIDKLGSESWRRTVRRTKKAVEKIARELLELYARRKSETGFQFSKRDRMFEEFELSFPYEETPDQAAAIEDVMSDMESPRPMDRLICGDVGFGKTEVAIRAAFKAVMDGKQVAVLVPTTLLASQHYKTFTERLKGYPVIVEVLSRFRTTAEVREILKRLESGTVDIVIGTHKLLGDKVKFKDLGLVIIDEEHRFGVKHKEKLRKLKSRVDVLTLSATPIPRTLQLSLAGIRDISVINSPPEGRQPVETYVFQFSKNVIREAITRELKRGGSVFFIHNRIEDIFRVAQEIRELVPEARVEVTHGRMSKRVLERRVLDFVEGRVDVLVTTAIVESGLDIPRANTIIVNEAHTFGLADLYQLRGRVGRSDVKAYAYLLVPSPNSLTPEAKKRLQAIVELRELGSGFRLALSDLEIRGAGNIFGMEQSGHIANVGLELYLEMLNKAIKELRREETGEEFEPEIHVNTKAFIPDDYIEDSKERLLLYKRISSVSSDRELDDIQSELRDRFGPLPEPAINLLKIVELKLVMKRLLISRIDIREDSTVITFMPASPFYPNFLPSGKWRLFQSGSEALSEVAKRLNLLTKKAEKTTG